MAVQVVASCWLAQGFHVKSLQIGGLPDTREVSDQATAIPLFKPFSLHTAISEIAVATVNVVEVRAGGGVVLARGDGLSSVTRSFADRATGFGSLGRVDYFAANRHPQADRINTEPPPSHHRQHGEVAP